MGWLSSATGGYSDKIWGGVSSAVGIAWDWMGDNPETVIGAVGGAAGAALDYMNQPDAMKDPTKATQQQIAAHNVGITKASKKLGRGALRGV